MLRSFPDPFDGVALTAWEVRFDTFRVGSQIKLLNLLFNLDRNYCRSVLPRSPRPLSARKRVDDTKDLPPKLCLTAVANWFVFHNHSFDLGDFDAWANIVAWNLLRDVNNEKLSRGASRSSRRPRTTDKASCPPTYILCLFFCLLSHHHVRVVDSLYLEALLFFVPFHAAGEDMI